MNKGFRALICDRTLTFRSICRYQWNPKFIWELTSSLKCLSILNRLKPVFLFLALSVTATAQNFPVDLNLMVLPPQSPAFHTFSQSQVMQTNKILLNATLKDLLVTNLDIGLRFEFRGPNGTFMSDPNLINLPINIQKGIPTMLSNDDLSAYFLSNDLAQNITDANGFMPEGDWEICVTAYELLNQEQVSRTTCFYIFLEEYDPPEIILPFDSILPSFPQNIQLSWQPLHIGAFPVQYNVEIWEVLEGFTEQQIVEATPPFFYKTVDQITSSFLTPMDLSLTVGRDYLMRVQIKDNVNGFMGLPVYSFKNQGYSNIHRFKYGMYLEGQECVDPGIPTYVIDDSLNMYVYWDEGKPPTYTYEEPVDDDDSTDPLVFELDNETSFSTVQGAGPGRSEGAGSGRSGGGDRGRSEDAGSGGGKSSSNQNTSTPASSGYYKMHFRDVTDGIEQEWQVVESEEQWALFEGYTRGHEYEIYITVVCSAEERRSESIFVKFATLPPVRDFSCGMPALNIDLSNERPLANLSVDDTIVAGDMRVVVLDVQGANGYYSGSGYMRPPVFGARIGLTFNDIFVNNEYRMVDGEMKTMYDPTGSNIIDVTGWRDFFPKNDEPFPVIEMNSVSDATFLDGKVTIYPGGQEYEAPLRVQTPQGDVILSGGMIVREVDIELPDRIAGEYKSDFSLADIHRYGFDKVDNNLITSYEEFAGVPLDNKSVARGGSDFLKFTLTEVPLSWTSTSLDSIRIISQESFEFEYEKLNDKEIKIKMPGLEGPELIYIIKGDECLGAFNLAPYAKTLYKINLIPVNGAGLNVSASAIQTKINDILKQGVVSTEVRLFEDQAITDSSGPLIAEKDVLDAYSDQMKNILQRHKDLHGQEENELYLFLVDKIEGKVVGSMPEGMNAGFIEVQTNETSLATTIAHELGHGAFTLEHFWKKTKYTEGNSDNLMDYKGGDELVIKQWNRMHNQKFPMPWFKKAEDQNYITLSSLDLLKDYTLNEHLTFLSNTGSTITLPTNKITRLVFATGGEFYVNTTKPLPIGTLTFFDWTEGDSTITYANYGSGKYYKYEEPSLENVFNTQYDGQIKPVILRTTYEDKKHAAHIVAIEDITSIEVKTNQAFDFLLPQFYKLEDGIAIKGTIRYFDKVEGINLGKEFQNSIYLSIIDNYSEFASPNRISSFYINGLAYFLDHNKSYFEGCGFQDVEMILQKLLRQLESKYGEKDRIINTYYVTTVTDYTENLCNLLGYWAEFSETEKKSIEDLRDIFSTLDPTIAIKEFQSSIESCNLSNYDEPSSQVLKDQFKKIFRSLPQCEFDQLKIPYAAIKILIETFLADGEFWVGNQEERLIVSLIARIKQEDSDDFLEYLNEEREYKVSKYNTGTISPYITTSSERKRLWTVLLDRVDNFMAPENGKLLMEEIMRVWAIANSTSERANLAFAKLAENITTIQDGVNLDTNFPLLKETTAQIIPYSYHSFFERLKNLTFLNLPNFPYKNIGLPITDVSIDEVENTISVSNKIKILFFVNGNFDVVEYKTFGPFEPVIIDKISQFGSIEAALPASNFSAYPGIIFYYLEKNAAFRTTEDVIFTTIDIATIAIPVTKIGALGKLLVYADKGSSLASLGATYSRDYPNSSELANLLNLTSAALGFASLAGGGLKALANIQDTRIARRELFTYLNGTEAKNLGDIPSTAENFDNLLAAIIGSGTETVGNLTVEHKQLLVNIIEERKAVLASAGEVTDLIQFTKAISKLKGILPELEGLVIELGTLNSNLIKSTLGPLNKFEASSGKNFNDLVIHSNGSEFLIDGKILAIDELDIATAQMTDLRLLSCNNIDAAQAFAKQKGKAIIANGGITRIHIDGAITIAPNGGDVSWYKFFPDGSPPQKILDSDLGITPTQFVDDFVELGVNSVVRGFSKICSPEGLSRFGDLGFDITETKKIFNLLENSTEKAEKLLKNIELAALGDELPNLVADLKKLEGEAFVKYLADAGVEEGVGILNAWGLVNDLPSNLPGWKTHVPLLTEISEITSNPALLNRLKGSGDIDGIDALKKILENAKYHPYTIGGSGHKWLPLIEDLLKDVRKIDELYPIGSPNAGFANQIISGIRSPLADATRRGRVYELERILIRNNPNADLGRNLSNGKVADYADDLKLSEFKSTDDILKKFDPTQSTNDYDQLRGYLREIRSFDNYDLIFDKKYLAYKNGLDPNDVVSIANHAKGKMQKVFKNNIDDLFDDLWNSTNIDKKTIWGNIDDLDEAYDLFELMVDNLDNKIFKSIKVE